MTTDTAIDGRITLSRRDHLLMVWRAMQRTLLAFRLAGAALLGLWWWLGRDGDGFAARLLLAVGVTFVLLPEISAALASRRSGKAVRGDWVYRLSPGQLTIVAPSGNCDVPLDQVGRVRETTREFVLILGGVMMPIPNAAFPADRLDEVRTLLRSRAPAAPATPATPALATGSLAMTRPRLAARMRRQQRLFRRVAWVAGALILFCAVPLVALEPADKGLWLTAAAAVALLGLPEAMAWASMWSMRAAVGQWTYRITEDTFEETTPMGKGVLPWTTIGSATESHGFIRLRTASRRSVWLDVAAFSAEEAGRLRGLLRARGLLPAT